MGQFRYQTFEKDLYSLEEQTNFILTVKNIYHTDDFQFYKTVAISITVISIAYLLSVYGQIKVIVLCIVGFYTSHVK